MGSADCFEYSQLSPDASSAIRLVRLERDLVPTKHGSIPQCSLTPALIDANASYTSLSYTWGNPQDTSWILIDGKYKRVTTNLAEFLNHARTLFDDEPAGIPAFWIDAISINQEDDDEKSEQVRNMGRIFSKASRVIIWLGAAGKDTDFGFKFLENLAQDYDIDEGRLTTFLGTKVVDPVAEWLCYIDQHHPQTIGALSSLLQRPWWQRIWVQQEVANAPLNNTSIACGYSRLPWLAVVYGQKALYKIYGDLIQHAQTPSGISPERLSELATEIILLSQKLIRVCLNSYSKMWPDERQYRFRLLSRLVMNSIARTIRVQASLAVDYIYSMLAISSDFETKTVSRFIDYSRPVPIVYTEIADYMLRQNGGMMLGFCGVDKSSSFPSWVPDWSVSMRRLPLSYREDLFSVEPSPQLYSAAGANLNLDYRIEGSRLFVRALEVDSVSAEGITPDLFPTLFTDNARRDWIRDWQADYEAFQRRILGDGEVPARFAHDIWRIPIADQRAEDVTDIVSRAPASMARDYDELREKFARHDQVALASPAGMYERTMDLAIWNRMPFLSAHGRLGIGANSMLPGDRVFLVLGCQTPVVLRDAGNGEYNIVGDVYIQGIMDGELVESKTKFETLVII